MANVNDVNRRIKEIIKNYSDAVGADMKKSIKKNIHKMKRETIATAPVGKRERHYKDNITAKKTYETRTGVEYTWYVKAPDYRLSHLLDKGHATKNGGRVEGTHFIQKATENAVNNLNKDIDKILTKNR